MDHVVKQMLQEGCDCERVKLRPLSMSDVENMFEYTSCAETCKYLRWGPHTSVEQTRAFMQKAVLNYDNPQDILWGIEEKSLHKLIGVIRIYDITHKSASISDVLNLKFTGKGYMTETVCAVIRHCMMKLSLSQVYADVVEENKASERVFQRCGFTKDCEAVSDIVIKGIPHKLNKWIYEETEI